MIRSPHRSTPKGTSYPLTQFDPHPTTLGWMAGFRATISTVWKSSTGSSIQPPKTNPSLPQSFSSCVVRTRKKSHFTGIRRLVPDTQHDLKSDSFSKPIRKGIQIYREKLAQIAEIDASTRSAAQELSALKQILEELQTVLKDERCVSQKLLGESTPTPPTTLDTQHPQKATSEHSRILNELETEIADELRAINELTSGMQTNEALKEPTLGEALNCSRRGVTSETLALRKEVQKFGFTIEEAKAFISSGGNGPEAKYFIKHGFSCSQAIQWKSRQLDSGDWERWQDAELCLSDFDEVIADKSIQTHNEFDFALAVVKHGKTLKDAKVALDALEEADESIGLLASSGLHVVECLAYKVANIPINEATIARNFQTEAVSGKPALLHGGKFGRVWKVPYALSDGSTKEFVFKQEQPKLAKKIEAAFTSGIRKKNDRLSLRSVATYAIAELLNGFENLIPHTEIGFLNKQLGVVTAFAKGAPPVILEEIDVTDLTIGKNALFLRSQHWFENSMIDDLVASERAQSLRFDDDNRVYITYSRSLDINAMDPVLQRQLIQLQLLDALTGQVDRNSLNYLIEVDAFGKIVAVTGIDNDLAFGANLRHPNDIVRSEENDAFRGVRLPLIVDRAMVEAFDQLTPEMLEQALKRLLTESEIDATKLRLSAIKEHLHSNASCRLIELDQWGSGEVTRLLTSSGIEGSYWYRDFVYFPEHSKPITYQEATNPHA